MILIMRIAAALVFVIAAVVPGVAHHSFSGEFDANQPIKLRGVIKKVDWMNPHIWYFVEVKNADGSITTWGLSGGAPGQLQRRGIMKSQLKLGATVVVEGFRARDGSNNGFGRSVTYEDGQSVFTANQQDRQ